MALVPLSSNIPRSLESLQLSSSAGSGTPLSTQCFLFLSPLSKMATCCDKTLIFLPAGPESAETDCLSLLAVLSLLLWASTLSPGHAEPSSSTYSFLPVPFNLVTPFFGTTMPKTLPVSCVSGSIVPHPTPPYPRASSNFPLQPFLMEHSLLL